MSPMATRSPALYRVAFASGFGRVAHDRNSGHSLRGVDSHFIEGVGVAFAMREIEANCEPLVRADEIHFFDYAVSEPAASFREIRVLADAYIFRTKHQLN